MSHKDDMLSQRVSDAFSVMDRFLHTFLLERGDPVIPSGRQVSFHSWLRAHDRSSSLSQAGIQILEKQGHIWLALHPQQYLAQVLEQSLFGAGLLNKWMREHSSWPWSQHDSICPRGFDSSIRGGLGPASCQLLGLLLILPE